MKKKVQLSCEQMWEIEHLKRIEWWKRDRDRKKINLTKVGDCFNRGKTCFGGIYWRIYKYFRSQNFDMSEMEYFQWIADVVRWDEFRVGWINYCEIESAIRATEDFFDSIVYYKFRNLRKYFKDMMLLVIYANRAIFDRDSKDFDDKNDYWEKIKGLINVYDWIFVEELKLFKEIKSEKHRFFLLGRLLVIAGYPKYNKDDPSYESEADYYCQSLNIKELIEGREVCI
jgi:hypothetical protein